MIRVIIADDYPVVRAGLDVLIQTDPYLRVVGLATNFEEIVGLLEVQTADIVVLDLSGMGSVPLTMMQRLRRSYHQLGVVIFSSSVDMAPELLQAGALGYVVKEEPTEHLIAAIRAASSNQQYVSPLVQEYLDRVTAAKRELRFSPQEVSVLKLLAQGLGTVQIAETLGIDPRSAQNYITSLRRKTNSRERTQLADLYRRYFGDLED